MIDYIKKLISNEKFRFLLVGGFNTFFGFFIFTGLTLTLKIVPHGYMVALVISQIVSNFVAFYLHRINLVVLPLLVNFGHMNPIAAQFLILIVTTMISFVGHKFFSFRRSK